MEPGPAPRYSVSFTGVELNLEARDLAPHGFQLGTGAVGLQRQRFAGGDAAGHADLRHDGVVLRDGGVPARHQLLLLRAPPTALIHFAPPKKQKSPEGPGSVLLAGGLDQLDVGCARAFRALLNFVLHLVVLLQRLEAARLDGREVHEKILAAIVRGDEAEALGVVEPLYITCTHFFHSLKSIEKKTRLCACGRSRREPTDEDGTNCLRARPAD